METSLFDKPILSPLRLPISPSGPYLQTSCKHHVWWITTATPSAAVSVVVLVPFSRVTHKRWAAESL